jgi:hypothetical protein
MKMKAYTDYPFVSLGDTAGQLAPVREIEVVKFDGNKYVKIIVDGVQEEIKYGYIYQTPGRFGDVKMVAVRSLPR